MPFDALLDFLFDNFFLVILIIGSLFRFFGRQDAQKKTKQPTRNENKDVDWKEIFKREQVPAEREQSEKPIAIDTHEPRSEYDYEPVGQDSEKDVRTQLLEQQAEMKRKQKEADEKLERLNGLPRDKADIIVSDREGLAFKHISRKEAIQGVVWAEILGQPRARKPHQSFAKYASKQSKD